MTDPTARDLIKRLAEDLSSCLSCPGRISDYPEEEKLSIWLCEEAEAYLAANPAAYGPTDEELDELAEWGPWVYETDGEKLFSRDNPEWVKQMLRGYARACIARWGRSPITE